MINQICFNCVIKEFEVFDTRKTVIKINVEYTVLIGALIENHFKNDHRS